MADELVELADADCIGPDGRPDNALVQQHRLQVDTWKWLLSKMLPKRFGDRVTTEIARAAAPLITRMRGNADGPPRPSAAFQPAFASPSRRGGSAAKLDDMMNWLHANCGTAGQRSVLNDAMAFYFLDPACHRLRRSLVHRVSGRGGGRQLPPA